MIFVKKFYYITLTLWWVVPGYQGHFFLENVHLYRTPPTLPHIALTLPKAVHTIHCHLHRAVKFQLILPQLSAPPPTTITISQSRPSRF